MIDRIKMQFANDVYQLYLKGIPLQKAIRTVQYLMNDREVQQAKLELMKNAKNKERQANEYRSDSIGKDLHVFKQKHGCYSHMK
jgi:hypothetical protein